jgi:hypothetical protein
MMVRDEFAKTPGEPARRHAALPHVGLSQQRIGA